jgi:hypothetical protein
LKGLFEYPPPEGKLNLFSTISDEILKLNFLAKI